MSDDENIPSTSINGSVMAERLRFMMLDDNLEGIALTTLTGENNKIIPVIQYNKATDIHLLSTLQFLYETSLEHYKKKENQGTITPEFMVAYLEFGKSLKNVLKLGGIELKVIHNEVVAKD